MDAKRLEEVAIEGGEKLCDNSARYRHCQRYQDKEESAKQKRSRSEAGPAMENEQETGVQSFGCSRKSGHQRKEDRKDVPRNVMSGISKVKCREDFGR